MSVKINVPVHNQTSNDILNDCGVACDQMLIHGYIGKVVSIESYYSELGITPGGMQSISDITRFLSKHGVPAVSQTALGLSNLIALLDAGKPVITLVAYKVLSDAGVSCYTGNFNHFVVVVGYDESNIIIHDPYCPGSSGAFRSIPRTVFDTAWRTVDTPYRMIVPLVKMGDAPTGTHIVTVSSALNIRSGPGTSFPIVGVLYNGQYVTVYQVKDNWGRIEIDKWSYMDYLKEIPNPNPPQPPTGDIVVRWSLEDNVLTVKFPPSVKLEEE